MPCAASMSSGLRYEAELARRRYMKVDPDNRLVADALEAEWNDKLRLHADAVEEYERRSKQQAAALDAEMRRRILDLAEQLPRIWHDPRVDSRERKRIVRLLVDDVTLIKAETITAHVRLSGGATRTLVLDRPLPIAQIRKFKPELVAEVDRLLDQHCDREIADILNQRRMAHMGRQALQPEEDRLHPHRLQTAKPTSSGCAAVACSRRARSLQSSASLEPPCTSGAVKGLIKKCYADSLNRGLWEIPSGIKIIKGRGGRDPHHAAIVPPPE